MKLFPLTLLASFGLSVLGSCSSKSTAIYQGECAGRKLTFSVKEKAQFDTELFWLEIDIHGLPLVKIPRQEILKGLPYDSAMLAGLPHHLFNTQVQRIKVPYFPEPFEKWRYLLFLDPAAYQPAEYEAISACLQSNSKDMEDALYQKYISARQHFNHPQLIGVVYGRADDLIAVYQSATDPHLTIDVSMEGIVGRTRTEGGGTQASALGYTYATAEDGALVADSVLNDLKTYRNIKTQRLLTDDFELRTKPGKGSEPALMLVHKPDAPFPKPKA